MNTRRWKLPAELENLSEDAYTSVKEWLGKTLVEAAEHERHQLGRERDEALKPAGAINGGAA